MIETSAASAPCCLLQREVWAVEALFWFQEMSNLRFNLSNSYGIVIDATSALV